LKIQTQILPSTTKIKTPKKKLEKNYPYTKQRYQKKKKNKKRKRKRKEGETS